jgi:hypothetical protein
MSSGLRWRVLLLLFGAIAGFASVVQSQPAVAKSETRELLVAMKSDHRATKPLAVLFETGHRKINDLIKALEDPDDDVSVSAQIVIRYLGNERGMSALLKQERKFMTGPFPIPVRESDYQLLRSQYLTKKSQPDSLLDAYLFALALDGSAPALQLLSDIVTNINKNGFTLEESRYLNVRDVRIPDGDLAAAVLSKATFMSLEDRRVTKPRLISCSGAKDKALVELYVDRGPLAEEWYHVVVSKTANGWRFFSITLVALS